MLKIIFSCGSVQHHIQKDRAEVARGYFQRTPNKCRTQIQTWLLTPWEMPNPSWIAASGEMESPRELISEPVCVTQEAPEAVTRERGQECAFSALRQRLGPDSLKVHRHLPNRYFLRVDRWSCLCSILCFLLLFQPHTFFLVRFFHS